MRKLKLYFLMITILLLSFFLQINAQNNSYFKENYNKRSYNIKMRDGIKLHTIIYSPKDTTKDYPIIFFRTPYSIAPYEDDKYADYDHYSITHEMIKEGYIIALQDVRGKFMSEGEYVNMRPYIPNKTDNSQIDETTDTYDSIDWMVKNISHNNGRVGMLGISYPGFYTAMAAIDSHPALKAISPQAPISNWFIGDDFHRRGAFSLSMAFDFFQFFGQPRPELTTKWHKGFEYASPDAYNFFLSIGPLKNVNEKYFHHKIKFWDELMEHGTYDDYWKAKNNLPHFNNVKPAVLTVGGWFDSEDLYGPLHIYQSIEEKNPSNNSTIVMGPWYHGGWHRSDGTSLGDINFESQTGDFYRQQIINPFFDYYLYDKGDFKISEALIFDTGKKKWNQFDQWPPKNIKKENLYFSVNHSLTFSKPSVTNRDAYDEYISDPDKPVPYYSKFVDSQEMYSIPYMIDDQRFASARPDVLVYKTETLKQDVTIAGPITANLFVSTSGTDSDFVVKIIDVYPDDMENPNPNPNNVEYGGYQMLVRYQIIRGKFRNSFENPEPFVPDKPTNVKFNLDDIFYTFKKDHKIMVQVQSSMFPFYDRNPQKFVDIYNALESDFQKATQRVYFSERFPSKLEVNIYTGK